MDPHDALARQRQRLQPPSNPKDSSARLKIPALPRFHPANFPSQYSNTAKSLAAGAAAAAAAAAAATAATAAAAAAVTASNSSASSSVAAAATTSAAPDRDQSQYAHAAQQYYIHKLEILTGSSSGYQSQARATDNPDTPHLVPAGSPGPITPFELEEQKSAGYIDCRNPVGEGSRQSRTT